MTAIRFSMKVQLGMAAVLLMAFGSLAHGQVEAGRFVGRITDSQGAVVANAT